ncbi:MAG: hypothetical protein ABR575_04605 [Actinomycetota bacterium]
MARAWPFEGQPEGDQRIRRPEQFVARDRDGTEAVIVRIGLHDTQLVLVGGRGEWQRWVYHSEDEARAAAHTLGVPVHEGEYPETTRVRMNSYQRTRSDFDRGAYPEQGRVGPVIPYPENRPRPPGPLAEEKQEAPAAEPAPSEESSSS